jgi:hypothetical protein
VLSVIAARVRSFQCRGVVTGQLLAKLLVGSLIAGCSKAEAPQLSQATPLAPSGVPISQAPSGPELPLVDLSGRSRPPAVSSAPESGPRLYSRAMRTWIYERPTHRSRRIGYFRAGSSSPTAATAVSYEDCREGWFPVEPQGFVCRSRRATLDGNDPIVRATRGYRPNPFRKLPYIYGTVRRSGPIYAHLPSASELATAEPDLEQRMQTWLEAKGEVSASYAQEVWLGGAGEVTHPRLLWTERRSDPLPMFLQNHASTPNMYKTPREEGALVLDRMRPRAGYAFAETVVHEGRRYGVTPDLKLLPTDRLRPIRGSSFHGVEIGKDIDFPFAFVRRPDAKLWEFAASRRLIEAGEAPYRSALKLTGKQQFLRGRLHYQTDDGKWISDRDASRLDPARRMPAWGKNGEKWLDINVTKQTLVAYAGTKAVYATLISTGEAGLEDPEHTTATKRGIFRIHTKHVSATMSSDEVGEEFELREVPYVQYFDKEGYALHGAYWHDRFGIPKSHGCINLAPEDARRIFYFTEPQVPTAWHGALLPLKGTVIFVHP